MFETKLSSTLHYEMEQVHLERIFSLPFAPFVGLMVCDFETEFEEKLVTVAYDTHGKRFYCETEYRNYESEEDFKGAIQRHVEHGWVRPK